MAKKENPVLAGVGYTVGNVLVKGINFLVLPIFSRIMTTEEFGVYNVFLSYDAILFVVIGLALHSSIRSANYEFEGEIDKYTSSISLIYFCLLAFFLTMIVFFGDQLYSLTDFSKSVLVFLVFYSFSSALITLYNNRISLEYSYKKYILISLINSVLNISLSFALILTVFRFQKDYGRILGTTISATIVGIIILVLFYKKAQPRFAKDYWKFGIKYSLPIVPHGIAQVLLAQFDRIMIKSYVGASAAGIFSLATNIKLILVILTDSISNAWSTWFFEQIVKNNVKTIQYRAFQLTAIFTAITIISMAISPELVLLLGGHNYESGKLVAIPMIVDAFLLFIYNIVVPSEYYKQKTIYIMIGTMVAAIVDIITNIIFIPIYGFVAAAYTTLFAYAGYLLMHLIISRHLVKFHVIPLKKLLFLICLVAVSMPSYLLLLDSFVLRWCIGLVISIPLLIYIFLQLKREGLSIKTITSKGAQ